MADLALGPILRYVSTTEATVWVETTEPCTVEVLGHAASTFRVEGHDYALVPIGGLEPGSTTPYEVRLDGERRWPPPDDPFPPPVVHTLGGGPLRVAFGSCRVALPQEPPYSLPPEADPEGRGPDALRALALRLRERPPREWPDLLVLLGDQVYADVLSPDTRDFLRARRSEDADERVLDFAEYRHLYHEAWSEPDLRWLLSTLPTAMIFDDHDVHDDWNTSEAWRREMAAQEWWDEHIVNALSAYWLYQHLGNLSPAELERDELYARVRAVGDGTEALREHALRADREPQSTRWSYRRDLGRTRLIVLDSRAGRIVDPERRSMLAEPVWRWLEQAVTDDVDHLLIATSLPYLLAPGLHDVEAWSEALCEGAWGRRASALGESLRVRFDLEHWAAFGRSFDRLAALLEDVAAGRRGAAPASVVLLSGDVHHSYLAEVAFRRDAGARSAVYQAVCSPFRQELEPRNRRVVRVACTPPGRLAGRLLARSAGRGARPIRWRLAPRRPWFDNHVAQLELDGRSAAIAFERAVADDGGPPRLETSLRRALV